MSVTKPRPEPLAPPTLGSLIERAGRGSPFDSHEPRHAGDPGLARRVSLKGLDRAAARARGLSTRTRAGRARRARAMRIIQAASDLRGLTDRAFTEHARTVREQVRRGRDAPGVVDLAMACATEATRRALGLELYPEQVMGGLAMSEGRCVEMATGEGKTLTAILPATLDGWVGRGVHVLTVNDYLATRDAEITRPVFTLLGLRVASLAEGMDAMDRRRAYDADITYAADKQVIFDFLRDRLVAPLGSSPARVLLDAIDADGASDSHWTRRVMQRGLVSAIVDEADSVLIDEAITPAILSIPPGEASEEQSQAAHAGLLLIEQLAQGEDYTVDRRLRTVRLTNSGVAKIDAIAPDRLPKFWRSGRRREELARQALTARELYLRDDDYVVMPGEDDDGPEVVIVDRATGRLLRGRQWQLGLHQAVEAKEGIPPTGDRTTAARVSYQQFFQRYRRLCGMSGTVWEVAGELEQWYGLRVERIPTHRPVIRVRAHDRVHTTERAKQRAVVRRTLELHKKGSPVLIGTRSVAESERLASMLTEAGTSPRVLNAQREAEEAQIVESAGNACAITVATNMAGRGTDIKLDQRARELGGLVVIATERNEERRVDRQLFGRAGRQGDPGRAESFVALDDRLIRDFGPTPLVWLGRICPVPLRGLVSWALWRIAQRTATARLELRRTEAAKSESWVDVSLGVTSR